MKITVLKQFNAVGIRILVNDLNSIDEYLSLFGIESYFEDTDFLDVYHDMESYRKRLPGINQLTMHSHIHWGSSFDLYCCVQVFSPNVSTYTVKSEVRDMSPTGRYILTVMFSTDITDSIVENVIRRCKDVYNEFRLIEKWEDDENIDSDEVED